MLLRSVQDTTFTCDMHMKDVTERSTVLVVLLPSNIGPQCAISRPYSGTQVRHVNYLAPNFGPPKEYFECHGELQISFSQANASAT
ncbi:hypothetical protein V1521DRAFT_451043, partial [Lipomyces starkeyi]